MSFKLRLNLRLQALSERSQTPLQPLSNPKSSPVGARISQAEFEALQNDDDAAYGALRDKEDGKTHRYELILHWSKAYWPDHSVEYQHLEFKAPATMIEAFEAAQQLADTLRRVAIKSPTVKFSRNNPPVNVIAVYRKGAFASWEKEHKGLYRDPNDFIKQTLAELKQNKSKAGKTGNTKYVKQKGRSLIKANDQTTTTR